MKQKLSSRIFILLIITAILNAACVKTEEELKEEANNNEPTERIEKEENTEEENTEEENAEEENAEEGNAEEGNAEEGNAEESSDVSMLVLENTTYKLVSLEGNHEMSANYKTASHIVFDDPIATNNIWIFESTNSETPNEYYIKNYYSGFYLEVPNESMDENTPLIQSEQQSASDNQKFLLTKSGVESLQNYVYITAKSSGMSIATLNDGQGKIVQRQKQTTSDRLWILNLINELPYIEVGNYRLTKKKWNEMFPYRADISSVTSDAIREVDFYSFEAFKAAIDELSTVEIKVYRKIEESSNAGNEGMTTDSNTGNVYQNYLSKTIIVKAGRQDIVTLSSEDWNEPWNSNKDEFLQETTHYKDFLNNGNGEIDKKELAAFLANISHETARNTSDGVKNKGLFYKREVACSSGGAHAGSENCKYTSLEWGNDVKWPPNEGQSYYGRGPIQTSWNYNYGLFSTLYYGDKFILLNNPDRLLENGITAFASAIHFWMYPVSPKPSCHQVINGYRGFAKTINVINGGLECGAENANNPTKQNQVKDRIDYYKTYANLIGYVVSENDGELACGDIESY